MVRTAISRPHRPVVARREHEADADLVDAGGDLLGGQVEAHAGLLEQVGTARAARDRAVAVLGDPTAGGRNNHRAGGGDVERADAITAGANDIDQVRMVDRDVGRELAHHRGGRGDLLDRLALHAQADQEAADLCRGGIAAHDQAHHGGHLAGVEVAPLGDGADRGGHVHGSLLPCQAGGASGRSARKLRSSA
jgi:hypothetical protein